jgi:SRSO17 transposase
MDVSQQVLKHLPRDPRATVPLIDHYCQDYQNIFPEVRSYECFKSLHLGLLSELKRKSLPEIAKLIPGQSSQALHHFLSNSPWLSRDLEAKRLRRILTTLNGRPLVVVMDETGDRKKGNTTDYVARQYLEAV